MTNIEKGMIIRFFNCFQNITLVAQIIGQPWATIKSFLTHAHQCQLLDNIPHPSHSVKLLTRHLQVFPVIHQIIFFGMHLGNILFQQDNASIHKTYSVMDWFERNCIELVENPPYFSDLNLIKNV